MRDQFLREETGSLLIADIRRDNGDSRAAVLLSKSIDLAKYGERTTVANVRRYRVVRETRVCVPAMRSGMANPISRMTDVATPPDAVQPATRG